MRLVIEYKNDSSAIPFCASTWVGNQYVCEWSSKSYADAEAKLIEKVTKFISCPPSPATKTIDLDLGRSAPDQPT